MTSEHFWDNYELLPKSSLTMCAPILSSLVGRQESENRHDDKAKYVLCQHCWLLNLSLQDHLPWTSDLYRLRGQKQLCPYDTDQDIDATEAATTMIALDHPKL